MDITQSQRNFVSNKFQLICNEYILHSKFNKMKLNDEIDLIEKFKQMYVTSIDTFGKDIEECIYKNSTTYTEYKNIYWRLIQNLSNPKNPLLIIKLLSSQINYETLIQMNHQELFPELYKFIEDNKRIEEDAKIELVNQDGILTCFKCKSKKTTYTTLQTRSADEPETVFALCYNCGKRWKQ